MKISATNIARRKLWFIEMKWCVDDGEERERWQLTWLRGWKRLAIILFIVFTLKDSQEKRVPPKTIAECMRTRKTRRKKNHKKLFIRLIQHVPWILIWHAHLRKSSRDSWAFVCWALQSRVKTGENWIETKKKENFSKISCAIFNQIMKKFLFFL